MRTRNICFRTMIMIQIFLLITGNHVMAANLTEIDTSLLPPDGGSRYNRLVFEKSPYLLQHSENPIDWYPWGEEAFKKAAAENKPVFLSIGYSTCHWCHVMASESFEDQAVADIINRYFVAIKVDREERPDIDTIYMKACQALTGGGGWPLTVIITPDKKPFYAGTYFPKENKYGRPGLIEVLNKIADLWETERNKILQSAESLTGFIAAQVDKQNKMNVSSEKLTRKAYTQLAGSYDEKHGGFGKAPKFPTPHQLMFLLRYWKRTGDEKALQMVKHTLTSLRQGGIYDQLGFGFHRYSTDSRFFVPHFEKMLYDQALLVLVYLEAYQVTKDQLFADTARETLEYVLRDMTSKDGGFFSAEDADSEGEEGLFYLWTESETNSILGEEKGRRFNKKYRVVTGGNYIDEVTREMTGRNILHLASDDLDITDFSAERERLFRERENRVRPFKDDKIITAWNGLMIAAMARAGRVLNKPLFVLAAEQAAGFILKSMMDKSGRLLRSHRDGIVGLPAFQDDYAFMVFGLMELYESTFTVSHLSEAIGLNARMKGLFWDEKEGAFNFSGPGNEKMLVPVKEFYDGAIPAGNSVALLNLLRLSRLLDDRELGEMAEKLIVSIGREAGGYPSGFTMYLTALEFTLGSSGEIVVAGKLAANDTGKIRQIINSSFLPNKTTLLHQPGETGKELEKIAPYTEFQVMRDGKATVYLCQDYTCQKPLTELEEIAEKIATFPSG